MYKGKTIINVIPARGGSQGVSRKNVRMLNGIPLIAYSIMNAQKSKCMDHVFVTTDDEEIAEVSRKFGAEVIEEPKELAQGNVTLEPVLKNALEYLEKKKNYTSDLVSLIQPTSPLLKPEIIIQCVDQVIDHGFDSCITAFFPDTYEWKWKAVTDKPGSTAFEPEVPVMERVPRQQLPKIYHENGAFYITKMDLFKKIGHRWGGQMSIVEMTERDSMQIDSEYQLWLIEQILLKKHE